MAYPAFSLRLRNPRVRDLIRVVAEREGISQNELLEQAAEHEVLARGSLLADELEVSAAQLRAVTTAAYGSLVEESMNELAEGEALTEPLRARQITRHPEPDVLAASRFGAIAAFRRGN